MKTTSVSLFQAAIMVMAVALAGCTTGSTTPILPSSSTPTLTAAGGLPGNKSLIEKELGCSQQQTPGYYSSLNGAEVADAQRRQLYPCADFLWSMTGPNQVSAQMSPNIYQELYGTSYRFVRITLKGLSYSR